MDSLFFVCTIFIPLVLIILIRSTSSTNLTPGPFKLPIIGNLHQFVGFLPHQHLRDLANKYGPMMHLQLGQLSNLVISSPELVEEVMKTHDLIFASRPSFLAVRIIAYNARDVIFDPYGEYWRQIKKICVLELLSAKRVQSFRSAREEEVSQLIRTVSSSVGAPVNLSKMLVGLLYNILSRLVFGKAVHEKDASAETILKTFQIFEGFSISDLFPSIKILEVISGARSKMVKVHEEVDAMIDDVIRKHRVRKKKNDETEDFVDVLLHLQDHDNLDIPLATDDIKGVIMDKFFAGVETTATLAEWTMSDAVQ